MAVRRRVNKSRLKMDMDMLNLWFSGYRDQMLEVFSDVETAQRFWAQHRDRLGYGEGWWEMFGPPDLRMSHPGNPDWLDTDSRDRERDLLVRRKAWLDEQDPARSPAMQESIDRHDKYDRWQEEHPR